MNDSEPHCLPPIPAHLYLMTAYFQKLRALLALEKAEDQRQYRQLTASASISTRRNEGLAWYPVAIKDSEIGLGDYLTIEVERTTHQDLAHQMRPGAPAVLFSNHDPLNDRAEGIITFQAGNRLKLSLRTDELPEWSRAGKLGIELLFDNSSYEEMEEALKAAASLEPPQAPPLIPVLTGHQKPGWRTGLARVQCPGLNAMQQLAVDKILSAGELAIVHGPPGTGKTTTLVQAIKAMLQQEQQQVLVVAPSNATVDLLSEQLAAQGLNVLRVGNPARVSEQLMSLTLEGKMASHPRTKEIKSLKKQAAAYRDMAHKYKRSFGKAERAQRKALFDEASRIMKDVVATEQYIIGDLLGKADVVAATLVGSNHYTVRDRQYHTVVIDEAGQAPEPACWIPLLKARKAVFAGDHLQLPPTIKSKEAAAGGLATTLMEKCVALYPEAVVALEEQYRMHEAIMAYPGRYFYEGRLKAHGSVAGRKLSEEDMPLVFIDTAGCGFEEKPDGTSTVNPEEAAFLCRHLLQQANIWKQASGSFPSVAVISPYKQQVALLQEYVRQAPDLQPFLPSVAVNTIDSFQGQERDVVYISMTRSNPDQSIGFLSDIRRMNVAMTRARKKLVIVGDSTTLSRFPFYAGLIAHAETTGAYQSAWEYMEL